MVKIRKPATVITDIPESIPSNPRVVCFRHPGYSDQTNVLFVLRGHDSPEGGLHHETARLACAIVAGNRWDGYLSNSATGPPIGDRKLLLESDYYFIVPPATGPPASPPPYPIVPSFREWSFPHRDLPELWNTLSTASIEHTSTAVIARDVSCRMTEYVEGCEVAQLCPKAELDWFVANQMFQYVDLGDLIDAPANALLLRADLHYLFDRRKFVFIPKDDGVIVTHVLENSKELRNLYHNTSLYKLGVSREFLFARFAWAIFPNLRAFFLPRISRMLKLRTITRLANPDECEDLAKSTSSRASGSPKKSVSPIKRVRVADMNEDIEDMRDWQANQGFDFATLVEEKLHSERDRSDPEGRWQKELQWLKDVQDHGSFDEADRQRYDGVIGRSVTPSDV